jgi:hypothetical protein
MEVSFYKGYQESQPPRSENTIMEHVTAVYCPPKRNFSPAMNNATPTISQMYLHNFLGLHRGGGFAVLVDLLLTEDLELGPGTGGALQLAREAQVGTHVDEQFGGVELLVHAELAGGVVEGVLVVPVVPALAHRNEGHPGVLGGPDGGVIGVVTVHVRRRVHQPGEVQHRDVAQRAGHPVAVPEVVTPQGANEAGEDKAHKQREPGVRLLLEHHERIGGQILKIQLLSSLDNVLVLLDEQPSHVCEEKSSLGVVRIRIRLFKAAP